MSRVALVSVLVVAAGVAVAASLPPVRREIARRYEIFCADFAARERLIREQLQLADPGPEDRSETAPAN